MNKSCPQHINRKTTTTKHGNREAEGLIKSGGCDVIVHYARAGGGRARTRTIQWLRQSITIQPIPKPKAKRPVSQKQREHLARIRVKAAQSRKKLAAQRHPEQPQPKAAAKRATISTRAPLSPRSTKEFAKPGARETINVSKLCTSQH